MYKIHDGNTTVYETFDELTKEEISWMTECDDAYYIKLKKEAKDDSVWKVDKQTEKAFYIQYPWYILNVMENATPIDPATLKRGA